MPLMIKLNRNVVRVYLCLDNGHFITVIINGVSYTCLTDEEYEDLQTVAAYEERKKSKDFKTISFDEFLKDREEKYGVKF